MISSVLFIDYCKLNIGDLELRKQKKPRVTPVYQWERNEKKTWFNVKCPDSKQTTRKRAKEQVTKVKNKKKINNQLVGLVNATNQWMSHLWLEGIYFLSLFYGYYLVILEK